MSKQSKWKSCWEFCWKHCRIDVKNSCKLIWWNDWFLEQKKQQNDIDFANVYCVKFLLIDAFWLIANFETKNHWRQRTNDCEKDEFI